MDLKYDFERMNKKFNIKNLIHYYFSSAGIRAVIIYRISNFLYKKYKRNSMFITTKKYKK